MKLPIGIIVVLITIAILLISVAAAQQPLQRNAKPGGTVCVLPNPSERPTRFSPGGEYNPDTLTVQIDKQEPRRWPHKDPLRIDDLDLNERHLVVLTSDGKRIQSFRFRFSDDNDAKLCMYFGGYQGVQLGNRKDALWCKAKTRDCWR